MSIERRYQAAAQSSVNLEQREDGAAVLTSLAAPYYDGTERTEYELWKNVRERIMPGAFDDAISDPEQDVRALFNHDRSMLLGRQGSGTLRLSTSAEGLRYEIDLADTTVARDVLEHVRRGDLTGSSFGFRIVEERWIRNGDDETEIREIVKVDLRDVGPVSFPAYTASTVALRAESITDARESHERWRLEEEAIRDCNAAATSLRAQVIARAAQVADEVAISMLEERATDADLLKRIEDELVKQSKGGTLPLKRSSIRRVLRISASKLNEILAMGAQRGTISRRGENIWPGPKLNVD